jgi:hypothetical protein
MGCSARKWEKFCPLPPTGIVRWLQILTWFLSLSHSEQLEDTLSLNVNLTPQLEEMVKRYGGNLSCPGIWCIVTRPQIGEKAEITIMI